MDKLVNAALAFIAKKLDEVILAIRNTPQKISLDVGDIAKPIASFEKTASELMRLIPEALKSNNKELKDAVQGFAISLESISRSMHASVGQNAPLYQGMLQSIDRLTQQLRATIENNQEELSKIPEALDKQTSSLTKALDQTALIKSLGAVQLAIQTKPGVDTLPIVDALKKLSEALTKEKPKDDKELTKVLKELNKTLSDSSWKDPKYIIGGGGGGVSLTSTIENGAKSSIGGTALQMTTSTYRCKSGVIVKAASTNTALVYVGDSSAVTANSNDTTDGFEIAAGQSITVPVDKPSRIYVIASAVSQKVFWTAQ